MLEGNSSLQSQHLSHPQSPFSAVTKQLFRSIIAHLIFRDVCSLIKLLLGPLQLLVQRRSLS